jgi:hypothetical protein
MLATAKTSQKTLLISIVWLVIVGAAFIFLMRYEQVEGPGSIIPSHWPGALELKQPLTLVVFLHPHCPCSEATVSELTKISDRHPTLKKYVVFLRPPGFTTKWTRAALWKRCEALPEAVLVEDEGGAISSKFHATTSGQSLLYDGQGKLLFCGGITAARGHEGDNLGANAIDEIAGGKTATISSTPVFGCSLLESTRPNEEVLRACRN